MRIDPENRALDGISTLLGFIALNLLYLLSCLPLVTIPVATSALYEVTIRYSDHESGRLLFGYFSALRRNLARATGVGVVLLTPAVLLVFAAIFWSGMPVALSLAVVIIASAAAVYLFAAFLHGMALVARYSAGVRVTIRNALLLPGAEPLRTFGILLVPATMVALAMVFPPFSILVLTIGFSVGAYGTAFLFRSVFARYSPE